MAAKPKQGGDYIDTMKAAVLLHGPCAELAHPLVWTLSAIQNLGIRWPNDWVFHQYGVIELRWYDGKGKSFSGSTKNISLSIEGNSTSIRGSVGKDRHSDDSRLRIDGMESDDALTVLQVLVRMVDKPTSKTS